MIVLGLILLIVGYILPLSILETIGILLIVVGAILAVLPSVGGPTINGPYRGRWW
jgi:hypothetical protein